MKVLVDASLTFKEDWFDLIPIIIKLDNEELIDRNEKANRHKIIASKTKTTSFYPPAMVRQLLKKGVVFTMPRKISGQYDAYKTYFKDNRQILILEGTCLITNAQKVKKIVKHTLTKSVLTKKITLLNNKTFYDGIICNLRDLPKTGRLFGFTTKILPLLHILVWLKFKDGVWRKHRITSNLNKTLQKIISTKGTTVKVFVDQQNKKVITAIEKIQVHLKNVSFDYKELTNAMLTHAGHFFVAIA